MVNSGEHCKMAAEKCKSYSISDNLTEFYFLWFFFLDEKD